MSKRATKPETPRFATPSGTSADRAPHAAMAAKSPARSAAASGAAAKASNTTAPAGHSKTRRSTAGPSKAKAAGQPRAKGARMSGLDAAAKVLADARRPMRCAEIIERILAKRLWTTKGRTPGATINAAMLREARDKGRASRFRKAGRGLFAATGKGR